MATYMVSYDLNKPVQNYPRLISVLQQMGAKKVLYSQWALNSNNSAVELRDHFNQVIDSNDGLLVNELNNWASFNAMTDLNKV
jgi:hypothetical protein